MNSCWAPLGAQAARLPLSNPSCSTLLDEDRGEDSARHHDDRLLSGRLEREQEKVLR